MQPGPSCQPWRRECWGLGLLSAGRRGAESCLGGGQRQTDKLYDMSESQRSAERRREARGSHLGGRPGLRRELGKAAKVAPI